MFDRAARIGPRSRLLLEKRKMIIPKNEREIEAMRAAGAAASLVLQEI